MFPTPTFTSNFVSPYELFESLYPIVKGLDEFSLNAEFPSINILPTFVMRL